MLLDFILYEIQRYASNDEISSEAKLRDITINSSFLQDLKKLRNLYTDIMNVYDNNSKRIEFLESTRIALTNNENPQFIDFPQRHIFKDFYNLFRTMITHRYQNLQSSQKSRLKIIAQSLKMPHIPIPVHKYDYYFHGIEDKTVYSNESIERFDILSNSLVVIVRYNYDLEIWNFKKSDTPVVFTHGTLDFRLIPSQPNHIVIRKEDGLVQIIDCEHERVVSQIQIDSVIVDFQVLPDGRFIYVSDDVLEIWKEGTLDTSFKDVSNFHIIGNYIAMIFNQAINIIDIKTYKVVTTFDIGKEVYVLDNSADGRLISIYEDEIKIWNLETKLNELSFNIDHLNNYVKTLLNKIVIRSDGNMRIIDLTTKREIEYPLSLLGVNILPNNDIIISSSNRQLIILTRNIFTVNEIITHIKVFPNGHILTLIAGDTKLKIYG